MAATTNTITYKEIEYTITYDSEIEAYEGGKVKNILTIGGENNTTLYTVTRYGVIDNHILLVKEMLDNYLKLKEDESITSTLRSAFGSWDGDLDKFISERYSI